MKHSLICNGSPLVHFWFLLISLPSYADTNLNYISKGYHKLIMRAHVGLLIEASQNNLVWQVSWRTRCRPRRISTGWRASWSSRPTTTPGRSSSPPGPLVGPVVQPEHALAWTRVRRSPSSCSPSRGCAVPRWLQLHRGGGPQPRCLPAPAPWLGAPQRHPPCRHERPRPQARSRSKSHLSLASKCFYSGCFGCCSLYPRLP